MEAHTNHQPKRLSWTHRDREAAMSTETHTPRSAGTDLTGPTKPYNVRLTMSLVAAAMNKVQAAEADPPSLAELIDELLEGYVGRA